MTITRVATECRIVDTITQWIGGDGQLNIREGDLVIDDGDLCLVSEIHWDHERNPYVRIGFSRGGALSMKHPGDWVAVRRYEESD